ncbi:MAG: response regulator transcription factor [Bdellovibrionales bacterium]
MRVLLAEDDPNISVIAKLSLEKLAGHQVTVVSDGAHALAEALTQSYDIILLDEMMPKMNGVRVCQEYKARCPHPKPVIFLSAKSQESDIREFFDNGTGYIPKPFDPTRLGDQIRELLRETQRDPA